jgi:hypothetical protein
MGSIYPAGDYSLPSLSWRDLSNFLGFQPTTAPDLDTTLEDFDKHKFWQEISRD